MCGLHGWVGKDPKKFDRNKLNILGILNETRGRDSCGIAIDGELFKGHVNNKHQVWRDFTANVVWPDPEESSVVIAHTRAATQGAYTESNAHPFKFELKDGNYFIGAHNGVIRNKTQLAELYDIDDAHKKIDSHVLLEILANYRDKVTYKEDSNKNDQVFVQYIGAAALMMYNSNDPDTLWVFRGESHDPGRSGYNSELIEERPLWFYQESEESMYICSLEDSLRVICDDPNKSHETIKPFRTNVLYKIKAGQIAERFEIDRTKVMPKKAERVTSHTRREHTQHSCSTGDQRSIFDSTDKKPLEVQRNLNNNLTKRHLPSVDNSNDYKKNNIYYEKVVFNKISLDIYFENLFYKRNGHTVHGLFIFIEELGLTKICDSYDELYKTMKDYSIFHDEIDERVHFGDITDKCRVYPIYKGVMLKNVAAWEDIIKKEAEGKKISTSDLSTISMYPIINMNKWLASRGKMQGRSEKIKVYANNQYIRHENAIFSGEIKAIGSYRTYRVNFGDLEGTTTNIKFHTPLMAESISIFKDGDYDTGSDEAVVSFEDDINDSLENYDPSNVARIIDLKESYVGMMEYADDVLDTLQDSKMVETFKEFNDDNVNKFKPILKTIEEIEGSMLKKV